jgi:branched-chain amino acid transport system ATP-binding protein
MTLLGIDDLEVSYGPVRALRGVSLAVGAGEIVGLIGANGAGKTTLLRSISGLIKAHAGRIHFQDRQLRGAGLG